MVEPTMLAEMRKPEENPSPSRLRLVSVQVASHFLRESRTKSILEVGIQTRWTDIVRIYPKPPKTFISYRIPKSVRDSIAEADRSLQANANIAACAMLGRALEAVCRDLLEKSPTPAPAAGVKPVSKRPLMLGEGIRQLKDKGFIDNRLFDWSQQLHAFRNLAAHGTEVSISRQDAEDLQSFVYAIIEYIYDLADRYTEFKERIAKKAKKAKKK